MISIHPTAVVEKGAKLDSGVSIGAFSYIGKGVKIGKNTKVNEMAIIKGNTTIGEDCVIYSSSIGVAPQDLKYKGEPSSVRIGNRVTIREYATIHRGTRGGGMVTTIDDDTLIMAYSHVAHDVRIGKHVIIANATNIAGHVTIGDFAVIGGLTGIHQFVRIGKHAMIGGASAIHRDVPPFMVAQGNRAKLEGINIIGLKRRGFTREVIRALTAVFDILFKADQPLQVSIEKVKEEFGNLEEAREIVDFIKGSKRGICTS